MDRIVGGILVLVLGISAAAAEDEGQDKQPRRAGIEGGRQEIGVGLTLVTNNPGDYSSVEGLTILSR